MPRRIINCIVVVECDDDQALAAFMEYCAGVMDAAAHEAAKRWPGVLLIQDVRAGEEIADDGVVQ